MKIETFLIPVKLLIIKACFRFLTFDSVRDKYPSCGVRVMSCAYIEFIKLIVFIKLIKLELQNSQAFALYHLLPNQLLNLINQSTMHTLDSESELKLIMRQIVGNIPKTRT